MKHPLQRIPPGKRRRVFFPLVGVFIGMTLVMTFSGPSLHTPEAPAGILSMELNGDPARARAIVESWSPAQRTAAGFNLGLDYLYPVVYSTGLALACVWTGDLLRARRWPLASAAVPLAWLQWASGVLDGTENLSILASLYGAYGWAPLARACSIPKFILAFAGIGYGLLGLAARYAPRLRLGGPRATESRR